MKRVFCVLVGALSLLLMVGGGSVYAENADPAYMQDYPEYIEIKNNSKENPLPVIKGREKVYYFDFRSLSNEEYNDLKQNYNITVYDNDDLTVDPNTPQSGKNILVPGSVVQNTIWDDAERRAVMQYKGNRVGPAMIVLYKKSAWGAQPRDIIYVQVFEENRFYVKDTYTGKYVLRNSNTDYVEKGQTIETLVVMSGIASNGANAMANPSSNPFSGTLEDSNYSREETWVYLGNSDWVLKSNVTKKTDSRTPFRVYKNINPTSSYKPATDTAYFETARNDIVVKELKINDKEYTDVKKDLATRMLTGKSGVNSSSNWYVTYVGDELRVGSLNADATDFDTADASILEKKSQENGVATFIAKKPGNGVILLKNGSGTVVEVFYVAIQYKIEVDVDGNLYNKDYIHEFIKDDQTLRVRQGQFPDIYVYSDDMEPLYERNIFWTGYWMKPGDTVKLVSYAAVDDPATFRIDDQFEAVDEIKVENLDGNMSGFKKVSQTVKLKDNSVQIQAVHFGKSGGYEEHFFVNDEAVNTNVAHLDIEVDDGGLAILTEDKNMVNGTIKRTETYYRVNVTKNYGSAAYNADGDVLMQLQESDYWTRINEGQTQFESTSAFRTNGNNELIDALDNIITDDVRNSVLLPTFVGRTANLSDIDKVEFKLDLKLIGIKKVESIIRDGEVISSEETEISDIENVEGFVVEFGKDAILKARNKCPEHNGLDFTASFKIEKSRILPDEVIPHSNNSVSPTNPTNPNTSSESVIMMIATLTGSIIIVGCVKATNKRR